MSIEAWFRQNTATVKLAVALGSTLIWLSYLAGSPFNLFEISSYYQEGGLFPWIILFFNLVWLFSRRNQLISRLEGSRWISRSDSQLFLGVLCCFSALIMTPAIGSSLPRRIFPPSLFVAGVFTVFGVWSPLTLSAVYGIGVFLPSLIRRFFEFLYASVSVQIFASLLNLFGYPVRWQGVKVYFAAVSGEEILMYVDSICAGTSSLTVFTALFVLITLDLGLKPNWRVAASYVAGSIGTYLQSIVRLIALTLTGFYFGEKTLWQTHIYSGYVIFLLYFIPFTFLYLRWTRTRPAQTAGDGEGSLSIGNQSIFDRRVDLWMKNRGAV